MNPGEVATMKIRKAKRSPSSPEIRAPKTSAEIRSLHRNLGKQKQPKKMKAEGTKLEHLIRTNRIVALKAQGYTDHQVASALNLDPATVRSEIRRAYSDLAPDVTEMLTELYVTIRASDAAVRRAWMIQAVGGKIVDPETGAETIVEKSEEAARIIQRSDRNLIQLARAMSPTNQTNIVTTGPVAVASGVDEMEIARLMGAEFRDAAPSPLVIDVDGSHG